LNLRRHRGLIDFGRKLFEDDEFFRRIVYGDKDIFRFMFLITQVPFYFVPERIGFAASPRDKIDSIVHSFNVYTMEYNTSLSTFDAAERRGTPPTSASDDGFLWLHDEKGVFKDSLPMFFHQVKMRNPRAFSHYLRIAPDAAGYLPPSFCFDASYRDRVQEESPPGARELEAYAEILFAAVDLRWTQCGAEETLKVYYSVEAWRSRWGVAEQVLKIFSGPIGALLFCMGLFLCCFFYRRSAQRLHRRYVS
jgi:hypothetical protein